MESLCLTPRKFQGILVLMNQIACQIMRWFTVKHYAVAICSVRSYT